MGLKGKIVVTNECFLTEKHLDRLKKLGEVEIHNDTTTDKQAIQRLKNAEIAIVDCFVFPAKANVLAALPSLKYISINSTGYDPLDLVAAKKHNILISNIPGYSTEAVAEHAIALMFAVTRKLLIADKKVRENPYEIDPADKTQAELMGFNLMGKTLGIIGLGNIGQRVAQIAKGIGMKVIAHNKSQKEIDGIEMVSLEEVLKRSDVVSLHVPLTAETENLISEKELALMKPHAVLINVARGKIVDTTSLFDALKNNKIGGAGLDLLAEWDKSNPLIALDNIIFTPHSAWFTEESFETLADMVVENVEAYVSGKPKNIIL